MRRRVFENDTITHAWEMVRELMIDEQLRDIVIDTGLPVIHDGVSTIVDCFCEEVLFLDPKRLLETGIIEPRWFTAWRKRRFWRRSCYQRS